MADQPVPSLSRAREQKIEQLSTHFANDDLTLEDLERRIERVYKATSVAELESITADLRAPARVPAAPPLERGSRGSVARQPLSATPPAPVHAEGSRILALMSSTRRVGRWAVPRKLDIVAVMSDTRIDMTAAAIPPGVVDVDLRVVMASFKLIVPPNVRVINEMHAFMADVRSRADELAIDDAAHAAMPVIRLTGVAFMAEVKVIVRRREDAAYYDDDEDDD